MTSNESTNFLFGATQCTTYPSSYHGGQGNTPNESVVHSVNISSSVDWDAVSMQSAQTIAADNRNINSNSHQHLQTTTGTEKPEENRSISNAHHSNSAILSPNNTDGRSFYSSLCRLEDIYPRRNSNANIRNQDETVNLFPKQTIDHISALVINSGKGTVDTLTSGEEKVTNHEPIEIRIRCIFSRVGEIDTLNERYTAEIFFEAAWYDKFSNIGTKYDPQSGHFNPQLVVLNHMGDSLRHEKWYSVSKPHADGLVEVTEHHKIRGVFWERMELNHFPYDVQELSLSLTTPLTMDDLYFTENKNKASGVNRTVFSDQQSWYLYEHVEFSYETHREEYSLNFDQVHPLIVCTCHVGRKSGYYVWNAYFLIFLITSASLCTFAIPPSNTHGRLQITCTLLLTSVTFRWVVNKSLPTISYLTALDVYAISSIVALCIINVFHGLISYIYYDQIYVTSAQTPLTISAINLSVFPEYSLCRLDRYAFFIFLSLFFIYQIFILFWTTWVPYKRRRAMSQKDEKNRAMLKTQLSNQASS